MRLLSMKQISEQQWLSTKLIESQSEAEELAHQYGFRLKSETFLKICFQPHIDSGKLRLTSTKLGRLEDGSVD